MTKRLLSRAVLLSLLAAVGAGAALALAGPIVKTSHSSSLGTILVDSKGFTLYHLTSEKNGGLKCTGRCASFWPPVLWPGKGKPPLGAGVKASLVGSVRRSNGSLQVTYNTFPLYRYAGDSKAGATSGEGIADPPGALYAVSPAGAVVKPAAATPSTTDGSTTTTAGTTTSSYRSGY